MVLAAQVMLNGHEFVACQASQEKIDWQKEDHGFTESADAAGLARRADTWADIWSPWGAVGRLSQACERWLHTTGWMFGLDLEEQQRGGFRYPYSTDPVEFSRHLQFQVGPQRAEVFQALIDRSRSLLNLNRVKTVFGAKNRPPHRRRHRHPTRWGVVVETPT